MATNYFQGSEAKARRDVNRGQMAQHGAEIGWLVDPKLATKDIKQLVDPTSKANPYDRVARWMAGEFGEWAYRTYVQSEAAPAYNRQGLNAEDRLKVRKDIRDKTGEMYVPGMVAMAQTFQCIPAVATREGITAVDDWLEIASRARKFGAALATNGTMPQAMVRAYLSGDTKLEMRPNPLDPRRMRLDDESGMTSITPVRDLMDTAIRIVGKRLSDELTQNPCTATQIQVVGLPEGTTMYDASWDFYGATVGEHIYPWVDTDTLQIDPPVRIDNHPDRAINVMATNFIAAAREGKLT